MVLQMARPWRDPDSGIFYLRKRVPRALLPQGKGTLATIPKSLKLFAPEAGP